MLIMHCKKVFYHIAIALTNNFGSMSKTELNNWNGKELLPYFDKIMQSSALELGIPKCWDIYKCMLGIINQIQINQITKY